MGRGSGGVTVGIEGSVAKDECHGWEAHYCC
jgi:hypothetical protein